MTGQPTRITLVLVAALIVGISGCATTAQVEEAMSMARQVQSDAAAARDAAGAAARTAEEAKRAAAGAQGTAESARSAADQANACCAANTEKLDRMFKESMRK